MAPSVSLGVPPAASRVKLPEELLGETPEIKLLAATVQLGVNELALLVLSVVMVNAAEAEPTRSA